MAYLARRRFVHFSVSFAVLGGGIAQAQSVQADSHRPPQEAAFSTALGTLEAKYGGRLGVMAYEPGTDRQLAFRADERFAMCSTHKALTVAAILQLVDRGALKLDKHIHYSQADLLSYAPVTRKNIGAGFMTVGALCQAAIDWSDNTAENLLLTLIGGPSGWTRFARSIGDKRSRLDRNEPTLNTAIAGDPRDTTTPAAMAHDLDVILLGNVLSVSSRQLITTWMLDNQITNSLLRAGVPPGWRVADKSGSGDNGTRNDIGLIMPPSPHRPIIACVYYTASPQVPAQRDAVIAQTGKIIADYFV